MPASNHRFANGTLVFLTSVSFFGLVLVALFTVKPPVSQVDFIWRKPLVGSSFAVVCVLGSLAAFFPNECSRGFSLTKSERHQGGSHFSFKGGSLASEGSSYVLRGHHPACASFSSHVFRLGGRVFCATCSGLFLGALVNLVVANVYFFGNWQVGPSLFLAIYVGLMGVAVGLLQSPLISVRRSSVRVFSGAFLAIGTLLIVIGVDELTRNPFLDVFLVFLTVLWLATRISLSQREHEKVCLKCSLAPCWHWHEKKK